MRYAGILREDHAFKLQRLFIVPPNTTSYNGLYVHYNADDLLGIIALESHRNKCVVIGEDLGTAPPGFKEKLKAWRILGYDVTRFQRHWDQKPQEPPIDPEAYRDLAIAVASNHDVSTLAGLVLGYHWQTLKSLGENSPAIDESMRAEQRYLAGDLQALYDRGLLSPEVTVDKIRQELATELTNVNAKKAKPAYDAFVNAMTRYLSGARSLVYGAQLEDVMGVREQINIPNTIEHTDDVPKSHPDEIPHRRNWRRRLPMTLDEMKRDVRFKTLFSLLKRDRGISG
jgi:4-alpha-glucanotransferase